MADETPRYHPRYSNRPASPWAGWAVCIGFFALCFLGMVFR